jgi:DNA-directed RNA polymerase beta' subunit
MAGRSSVQYVGFALRSGEEIERESYAAITSHELLSASNEPVLGGVFDLRLGTTDHGYQCLTCGNGKRLCPGHRGHLKLNMAVPQPIGIAEIRRWLRVVCFACGEILPPRERYAALPPGRRLAEMASVGFEGKRCPNRRCGVVHPKVVKDPDNHFGFWAETAGDPPRKTKLYPDAIRAIFERVTDGAAAALGRGPEAHPSRLLLRVAEVPPSAIRPGVRSFSGGNSYHDSTNLLQGLVRHNALLEGALPDVMMRYTPGDDVTDEYKKVDTSAENFQQIYYNLIYGSSSTSATQGNSGKRGLVIGSRQAQSILRKLPRKEGRIRANLLGKRIFYVSRSTISGKVSLRIDEVGIPLNFARTLQVEETAQPYNLDFLRPFFLNGRRRYPGCTHVIRKATGETHDIDGLRGERLEVGDVIYRDVINGDLAYFNRQPTLERSSIGVHRVVVNQDPSNNTLELNVIACSYYNADFDGDQMNLWVARGPGARAEALVLSDVSNWFISSKTSGPVNGQVQDSIIGCYALTRLKNIDKYHAMGLLAGVDDIVAASFGDALAYSGADVVSTLFRHTPVSFSRPPKSYNAVFANYIPYTKEEMLTVMKNGRLVQGVLDKAAVGEKANGGLFHLVGRLYGSRRALDLVFALQQVALQTLMWTGFTVGTADLVPDAPALAAIRALVGEVLAESQLITDRLLRGEIVPPIDTSVREHYEQLQREALKVDESRVLRAVLGCVRPATNGLYQMIATGAKGSVPNMIQISAVIGQVEINGARIREQFAFRRTLPYFPRFATSPFAYGYVASSYIEGMRSTEAIFSGMNGRFDLINKALSTASTGYFARKGVMCTQSAIVDNHRRVSMDRSVVQFLYGEDGLDCRELEKVKMRTVALADAELRRHVLGDLPDSPAAAAALAAVTADRDWFRVVGLRLEAASFDQPFRAEAMLPVNVERLVADVVRAGTAAGGAEGLDAKIAAVAALCDSLPYVHVNGIAEGLRRPVDPHKVTATRLMQMLVRAELCPRVLAELSIDALDRVCVEIRLRYRLALVDYGTAAGIIAAQAISEPLTQRFLDSHHASVEGGTTKTGITRVAEIYGALPAHKERSARMLLVLNETVTTAAAAEEVAIAIEYVTLRDFVSRYDVLLEPIDGLIFPGFKSDAAWIAEFERNHPLVRPPGDLTNWCVRVVIDKSRLVLKAVDLELIVRRVRTSHPGVFVVRTSEAAEQIVVRVWHRATQFRRGADQEDRVGTLLQAVLDTPVRGIPGITRAVALTGRDAHTKRPERTSVGPLGALTRDQRFAVRTVGSNLYSAMLHPAVDPTRVVSSSIGDTYAMFGIEAARAKIISETVNLMEDSAPNPRHLQVYADVMTKTGRVTSLERGGLGLREHSNVLLRMSFGAPLQVLTDATLANVRSKVYGVAATQVLGGTPQIGSAWNDLVVDEEYVRGNVVTVDRLLDQL